MHFRTEDSTIVLEKDSFYVDERLPSSTHAELILITPQGFRLKGHSSNRHHVTPDERTSALYETVAQLPQLPEPVRAEVQLRLDEARRTAEAAIPTAC